jgi:hypothetical protein
MHLRARLLDAALLTGALGLCSAASAQVGPQGTYSDWQQASSPSNGFFNLDITVFPGNEPDVSHHGIFYAHQFGIRAGAGGYVGLQKDGNGKRAIFSIWDALAAGGPGEGQPCGENAPPCAGPFGGEGEGYQTMVPFEWEAGHYYTYRVWVLGSDTSGTWWGGWIIDEEGAETFIGEIKVPASWQWLDGYSITWVEYYANSAASCSELGYSVVYFDHPTGDADGSSAGAPSNHYGSGVCSSLITDYGNWAQHESGL